MYNVNFTMEDVASGVSITMNHYVDLPDYVKSKTQLVKSHFARISCTEFAKRFFGTDDVIVRLNAVDGIKYAY